MFPLIISHNPHDNYAHRKGQMEYKFIHTDTEIQVGSFKNKGKFELNLKIKLGPTTCLSTEF
jgi:hypothetical protein